MCRNISNGHNFTTTRIKYKILSMKKYLRIKDLIEILKTYDENLPVIVTDEGKDHQYGIKLNDISLTDLAYFGNDNGADVFFTNDKNFLNIANL